MPNNESKTDVPDEERMMNALRDLCAMSSRQTRPGIQVVSSLDHLEVTLRFDSSASDNPAAAGQTRVLNRAVLRNMAGMIAGCAL